MRLILPARARQLLEPHLPTGHDIGWFADHHQANAMVVDAEIAWVDQLRPDWTAETVGRGTALKWLNTVYAGIDSFPLAQFRAQGTILTNGTGINAIAVAEYALLGILAAAKRYDAVVRLADAREWPADAPGKIELYETSALIVGMGAIGGLIADRLRAFGVTVTGVTRSGRDDTLTPDAWQAKLGEFDWVILAAPSTDDTKAMIGADELALMKPTAWLINIARGDMIDQPALIEALAARRIAGAFLDTVHPEPLPADDPLWTTPNVLHSMHLSGRSQTKMFARAATLFLANLDAFLAGKPMRNVVDLDAGY